MSSLSRTASWVIVRRETGEVVFETFDPLFVGRLNTEAYVAVPILAYLQAFNANVKTQSEKSQ
jgi:hypothetical protein